MRREYTQTQSPVIVGTDGGAQGKTFEERVASWAVSVGNTTVGGEVPGLDQTPKAAEYWAAERAIQAGVEAKVPIHLLIDNMGVQKATSRMIEGGRPPDGACPQAWDRVERLLQALPSARADWVPAHGRHRERRPPEELTAERCRAVNDAADVEAAEQARRLWDMDKPQRDHWEGAARWSAKAMEVAAEMGTRLAAKAKAMLDEREQGERRTEGSTAAGPARESAAEAPDRGRPAAAAAHTAEVWEERTRPPADEAAQRATKMARTEGIAEVQPQERAAEAPAQGVTTETATHTAEVWEERTWGPAASSSQARRRRNPHDR
jgi:hypothetical protein